MTDLDPNPTPASLSPESAPDPQEIQAPVPERSLLLFQQQIELGLPLEAIQEILNPTQTPITPVPNTLAGVRGVLNLRGQILLVLDLGYLLRYRYNSSHPPNRIIVLRSQSPVPSDSRPPDQLGLLVERVHSVVSAPLDQIQPVPDLDPVPASWLSRLSPLVMGTVGWEDRPWQLLSVSALLDPAHWV